MTEQNPPQPGPDEVQVMEWAAVRAKRDQLIRATDYTQVTDTPLSEDLRLEVAAYRQALRDIPQNVGDPFAVVWPDKPAFLK